VGVFILGNPKKQAIKFHNFPALAYVGVTLQLESVAKPNMMTAHCHLSNATDLLTPVL